MKTLLRSALKPQKQNLLTIKCSNAEMKTIKSKADKYTNGNVSEWVRYAAMTLDPRIQDLITVKNG